MTRPPRIPGPDIERMAQAAHSGYLADHEELDGAPDHPAAVPWEALSDELKAQNRRQARDNVRRIASFGLMVVPEAEADPSRRVTVLEEDVVEVLARKEHDAWYQQKVDQGYVRGEPRDDIGPPKTHPDLLAWADLDDRTKEKDKRPIRRLFDVLAAGGWAAVREADDEA